MQRFVVSACAALLVIAGTAGAQGLDGKAVKVKIGANNAPVTLAWPGDAPTTSVDVIENGKAFPATVRNGELVFVPEGEAGSEHTYTVRVTNQTRQPRVQVKPKEGNEKALQVLIDGKLFTEYHFNVDNSVTFEQAKQIKPDLTEEAFKEIDANNDGKLTGEDAPNLKDEQLKRRIAGFVNRKPFLWPVLGEGDVTVTRNWPMGEAEGPTDHEHQKSFWTAHGDVSGADLWSETFERSGYQIVEDVQSGSGDAYGWITSKQTWQKRDHTPVVTEVREYRFYATPASKRLFDVTVTFTADHGDAVFGDTKEGGIVAFRIRPEIQEKGGTGVITTANGQGESNVWGKPAAWSDYTGEIKGAGQRGIAILDHPSNLRHPVRWHIRSYGLNGANYFGLHDFEKDSGQKGDWTLENGKSQTFKYRVGIHSGDVNTADIAGLFADFATPATATVE